MALPKTPGSWLGFLQQGSNSAMVNANDDTQPPSQPFEADDVPFPAPPPFAPPPFAPPPFAPQLMTLEELFVAPGRTRLPNLDPNRENGAGWLDYTKGITKSVKKIIGLPYLEILN